MSNIKKSIAKNIVKDLLREYDRNTCQHEEKYRGGAIWTICSQCGAKWADDEGGFKPYVDPPAVVRARDFVNPPRR